METETADNSKKRKRYHTNNGRLQVCKAGVICLKLFCITSIAAAVLLIFAGVKLLPQSILAWLGWLILCICIESLIFWTGIICVYCTSVQLGINYRILGLVCGLIPIVHLVILFRLIQIVSAEVRFETEKEAVNEQRKMDKICQTQYPVLLVHGVFFRDFKYLNYWGRIPDELIKNGARVYYGNQQSAESVEESAKELVIRIKQILEETGCEKVNVIAHSKGGLDCRYAVSLCGVAPYVASITTINTPHKGCEFADYLLTKIPQKSQEQIAGMYNGALRRLGDARPDFMKAVYDLTASRCTQLTEKMDRESEEHIYDEIFCQSIGSKLNKAVSGKFPLNFTYSLVKYFDGANDGLVSEKSFVWGERYRLLTVSGNRGISHGDMIDLNRENIPDFDVREFYVQLVADLKMRNL